MHGDSSETGAEQNPVKEGQRQDETKTRGKSGSKIREVRGNPPQCFGGKKAVKKKVMNEHGGGGKGAKTSHSPVTPMKTHNKLGVQKIMCLINVERK